MEKTKSMNGHSFHQFLRHFDFTVRLCRIHFDLSFIFRSKSIFFALVGRCFFSSFPSLFLPLKLTDFQVIEHCDIDKCIRYVVHIFYWNENRFEIINTHDERDSTTDQREIIFCSANIQDENGKNRKRNRVEILASRKIDVVDIRKSEAASGKTENRMYRQTKSKWKAKKRWKIFDLWKRKRHLYIYVNMAEVDENGFMSECDFPLSHFLLSPSSSVTTSKEIFFLHIYLCENLADGKKYKRL